MVFHTQVWVRFLVMQWSTVLYIIGLGFYNAMDIPGAFAYATQIKPKLSRP